MMGRNDEKELGGGAAGGPGGPKRDGRGAAGLEGDVRVSIEGGPNACRPAVGGRNAALVALLLAAREILRGRGGPVGLSLEITGGPEVLQEVERLLGSPYVGAGDLLVLTGLAQQVMEADLERRRDPKGEKPIGREITPDPAGQYGDRQAARAVPPRIPDAQGPLPPIMDRVLPEDRFSFSVRHGTVGPNSLAARHGWARTWRLEGAVDPEMAQQARLYLVQVPDGDAPAVTGQGQQQAGDSMAPKGRDGAAQQTVPQASLPEGWAWAPGFEGQIAIRPGSAESLLEDLEKAQRMSAVLKAFDAQALKPEDFARIAARARPMLREDDSTASTVVFVSGRPSAAPNGGGAEQPGGPAAQSTQPSIQEIWQVGLESFNQWVRDIKKAESITGLNVVGPPLAKCATPALGPSPADTTALTLSRNRRPRKEAQMPDARGSAADELVILAGREFAANLRAGLEAKFGAPLPEGIITGPGENGLYTIRLAEHHSKPSGYPMEGIPARSQDTNVGYFRRLLAQYAAENPNTPQPQDPKCD